MDKATRLAGLIAAAFEGRPRDFNVCGIVGSFTMDLQSGELRYSPEIYQVFGLPEGPELREEGLALSLCMPDSARMFEAALHNARSHGQSFDLELNVRHGSGGIVRARVTAAVRMRGGLPWLLTGTLASREGNRAALRLSR